MRRQRPAQAGAVGGQVAGEVRVILREAGPCAERLLPHRAAQTLAQGDQCAPRLGIVGSRAHDERRRGRAHEELGELAHRRAVGSACSQDPGGSRALARLVRLGGPVVHRDDHECRAAGGHRLVARAGDRARHILRPHRLVDPHRVLAREPVQAPGEKRLEGEMAPVLLADEDDERRAVDAGGGQRADRVPEPGRGVEDRERGLVAPDRPAGRHAHHRGLVQAEDEAQVVRQVGEQMELGRPGVREECGQPLLAQDLEGGVAHGAHRHRESIHANDLTFRDPSGTMPG